MLAKRISDGLLSAIRDEMLDENTDSKSTVVVTKSKIDVKLVQDVNKYQSKKVVAESTNQMVAVKSVSKPPAVCVPSP